MPSSIIGRPVSDRVRADLRAEFTLPTVDQVRWRLTELTDDPEPVMRQLVRVFIGEGTYCPGFQFLPGGYLHTTVTSFSAWMIIPTPVLGEARGRGLPP